MCSAVGSAVECSVELVSSVVSNVLPSVVPGCIDRPRPGLERHSPACSIAILDHLLAHIYWAVSMPTKPRKAAAYELGSPPGFSTDTDSACGRSARRVSLAKLRRTKDTKTKPRSHAAARTRPSTTTKKPPKNHTQKSHGNFLFNCDFFCRSGQRPTHHSRANCCSRAARCEARAGRHTVTQPAARAAVSSVMSRNTPLVTHPPQ